MSFSRCFRKKRLGVLPQCRTGAASTLSPFGISDYRERFRGFERSCNLYRRPQARLFYQ